MSQDNRLPYWPAALNKKTAAAYCGLSVETFMKVCPIRPIAFTPSVRGERYLRQRLDGWLLSLDPNARPSSNSGESIEHKGSTLNALEEWRQRKRTRVAKEEPSPVSPDFDWREQQSMEFLVGLGPNIRAHWRTLKDFGPSTQKKLEDRGYIGVSYENDKPDKVWLTKAGLKAMRELAAHRRNHPML